MKSVGREILWNLPRGTAGAVYAFSSAAAGVFVLGAALRLRSWMRGRPERERRFDRPVRRAWDALEAVVGHRRIFAERPGGIIHAALFAGFAGLFLATVLVAAEHDFGAAVLDGGFYFAFKIFADTSGLLLLLGVVAALVRRCVARPAELATRGADLVALCALGAVAVSGFLVESVRLAATGPVAAPASYAGNAIASILRGIPLADQLRWHRALWWTHLALALGFLASLPFGKMVHVVAGPANVFLKTSRPPGALQPLPGFAALETLGAGSPEEFSWKQLLDLDACVQCGRCEALCPARLTGKTLSPQKMIRDLRASLRGRRVPGRRTVRGTVPLIDGGGVSRSDLWACTTCAQCAAACPAMVEHVEKIVDMRRYLVLGTGTVPEGLEEMFRRLELYGDPWGMGAPRRTEWAAGLGLVDLGRTGRADVVYWVGCAGAFDDRSRAVAVAMAGILRASGVSFGILGANESCCGDFARRAGNEYLFHRLATRNIEVLAASGAGTVVTSCPHCFNALRNDYRPLGGSFDVVHHTEWIDRMLGAGVIRPRGTFAKTVAYHDPCSLGRGNRIYEPPRAVLRSVGGVTTLEAGRSREAGFCCGAGGGALWLEEQGERINAARTKEILGLSPDVVATACPHCLSMLEDGLGAAGGDGPPPPAMDIAEIVARSL